MLDIISFKTCAVPQEADSNSLDVHNRFCDFVCKHSCVYILQVDENAECNLHSPLYSIDVL